jgi:uncharacterized protein YfaS (alpha-2-macroglobulin family)
MLRKRVACVVAVALVFAVAGWHAAASKETHQDRRDKFTKAYRAGNYRNAYDGLRKLALDPGNDPLQVGSDLDLAVTALQQLGRSDEIDEFREAVITAHAKNWRLLETAARSYENTEHYGYLVAGKFYRGYRRAQGRWVNVLPRDRVRALQLMQQALKLTAKEKDKGALASFHLHFANTLLQGGGYYEPWRLQYLTDISKLPDYEDGYHYYGGHSRGAPVDENGNPVFHKVPKSYEAAASDGERWRWMLVQAKEFDPARANEVDMIFANFLYQQFEVRSMAYWGAPFRGKDPKSGTFALHTLTDDETIAKLATGIKRFKVPAEFNWIKVYERVAARGNSTWGAQARDTLASIYEDRRQYPKAADAWRKAIADYGPGPHNHRQQRLDQIVGKWGRFEPMQSQPAGKRPTVDFRFRNGNKVAFEAHAIKVAKLLDDVKAYLKSNPGRLDWQRTDIANIGYRLVTLNQAQYVGDKMANWDVALKPPPKHVDDRITVTTPLDKAGAYLLTAKIAGGNVSRVIVWVSDTVIVKKQLDGKAYYFVADALTGQPVPAADLEFFGYKQVPLQPFRNEYRVETTSFNKTADADGQVTVDKSAQPQDKTWLITARKARAGVGGADRFAYLGFSYTWYNQPYDPAYNATKVFTITDRPVYRPEQTVQFKFWIRHAKYDQADTSDFANRTYTVQINDPRGQKVFAQAFKTDEYAGLAGEFALPKGAMLGAYAIHIPHLGGGSFRVEEYKKPEFEVMVEAPKEPVRLGEKVKATIKAKYYFGAPVTQAKVKYKVLRTPYSNDWYPRGRWDQFYGPGYWWFSPNYTWYPGWNEWGCNRPVMVWWRWGRGHEPPEVVLENEVPIGPDGTVEVPIDTTPAKELHGDQDHQYAITAEVVDESRRTIVGTGNVLVARQPFKVFTWLDRGHYRAGDTVNAFFQAQTLDRKPVQGKGKLTLFRIGYDRNNEPVEKAVEAWDLDTNDRGRARQKIKAARAGQFRVSYKLTDAKGHTIEGGYLFVVRGTGFTGAGYRFNDIELVTDKREYAPGQSVNLLVNVNRDNGVVLLFVRPTSGQWGGAVYQAPKVLRLKGRSFQESVAVVQRDMPNFYVEAVTVADGRVHSEVREVVVPPEKRVLNVAVEPSQTEYRPGQKATVKVKLTDFFGRPFVGSTVLSVYDRSVEYISGGSNVGNIVEFFWKWRRHLYPQTEASIAGWSGNILKPGEIGMYNLGVFGERVVEELATRERSKQKSDNAADAKGADKDGQAAPVVAALSAAPGTGATGGFGGRGTAKGEGRRQLQEGGEPEKKAGGGEGGQPAAEPAVRKNFADTAFWSASVKTDKDGLAEVTFDMPENLTGWKVKVWAMGHGTKVGEGSAEVVTKKDLLVRLQAPRFFVQKDEVVLSANVHNYLKKQKAVKVTLDVSGETLSLTNSPTQTVSIPAGGEKRVDWRVKVKAEGQAVVRVKAVTDEESDAMEMRFPSYVHGMLKMDSFSGVIRPDKNAATVLMNVPRERRINESRLEVRYSPTLAGAMVDALPYMVEYPYGCTEQTLNRFLPTVITQRVLQRMKLDLKDIEKKRTNLNAAEMGDAKERAKGWKRYPRNPVFDEAEVKRMADAGVLALAGQQIGDGGWGWFSGWGERSWPHTTAVVVHGLQVARENDIALPPQMLERGVAWLANYQAQQIRMLNNAPSRTFPWKDHADNLDALVYMVLVDASQPNNEMRDFLYRDRTKLAVYAKAMYGLALHKLKENAKLEMILENIDQFLQEDKENQTTYLKLPAGNAWWYWYGSEVESNGYYLKLLARTKPRDEKTAGLVKYLLNNRKHATYWNNTRDTAVCIEAMAEYLRNSGEDRPDMTVEAWLDGKKLKEVKINKDNLFSFDNVATVVGDAVEAGTRKVELKKKGKGPLYFNAYLTNFTLEDFITRAGLEVKVNRKYYKLTKVQKKIKARGSRGQAADQKVEKYERTELPNLAKLKSGDLVEVELEIDSKNDYEYLCFEDPKAAGFEPMLLRSGYNPNDMGAYMELRDDRVCFFVRVLARGKHSVSYRMRAEIPGRFSALPTRAYAMYAPELKGNSDEIKLMIED